MNKGYNHLTKYLISVDAESILLDYDKLEEIIQHKLPPFIHKYPHRFFNNNANANSYFKYWSMAGFVAKPSPKDKKVLFEKVNIATKDLVIHANDAKKTKQRKQYTYKQITLEEIERQHQAVQNSFNYGKENKIINDVFNQFKKNVDINVIAMKIAVIDITNSTQLSMYKSTMSLYDLAKIILEIKDFDKRVAEGDPELVNEIAKESKRIGKVNLFSFATKYCCYHNVEIYDRDDYSIYDSILRDNLSLYIQGIKKSVIDKCRKEFDYRIYNDLIGALLDANNINIVFKRRKLDHYIWYTHRGKNA